jgi:hypothetical protein
VASFPATRAAYPRGDYRMARSRLTNQSDPIPGYRAAPDAVEGVSIVASRRYAKGIMMSFKRLPVTLLPILLLAVIVVLFIFYVPAGGDLISRRGDIILGGLLGGLFSVCVSNDLRRFIKLAAVRKLDALANKSGDEKK